MYIARKVPLSLTITPGSIVSMTPELTWTAPSSTYGLPDVVHSVFDVYVAPEMWVVASACATSNKAAATTTSRQTRMRQRSLMASSFEKVRSVVTGRLG